MCLKTVTKISPYAVPGIRRVAVNSRLIMLAVLEVTGETEKRLMLKTRKREIVEARQLFWMLCKKHTSMSLAQMGAIFGKDHATALHGIKTITNLIETSPAIRHRFREIGNIIYRNYE